MKPLRSRTRKRTTPKSKRPKAFSLVHLAMGVTLLGAMMTMLVLLRVYTPEQQRQWHEHHNLMRQRLFLGQWHDTHDSQIQEGQQEEQRVNNPMKNNKKSTKTDHIDNNSVIPPEYSQAYTESNGFFNDIPSPTWNLMKQRTLLERRHPHFVTDPAQDSMKEYAGRGRAWYQMNWEPHFTCPHERRVGGMGDGPKWVCDPHRIPLVSSLRHHDSQRKQAQAKGQDVTTPTIEKTPACLMYSIGSKAKFQFEYGIANLLGGNTCEMHIFDLRDYSNALDKNDPLTKHFYFHPWGLARSGHHEYPGGYDMVGAALPNNRNFKSLQQTILDLHHVNRTIDVFKIDCEGCEWTTFKDWLHVIQEFDSGKGGVDIRQILVEVHKVPPQANDFFENLMKAGFVTFHKEPNTYGCSGDCVEYAFLRLDKSFFKENESEVTG